MSALPSVLMIHGYYRSDVPSGEAVVFDTERRILAERGHRVLTYTRRAEEIAPGPAGAARAAVDGVWARAAAADVAGILAHERPGIVHVHNTFPLISASVYEACHAAGIPVVQTVHNFRSLCVNASLFRDGRVCTDCVGRRPWRGIAHGCYRGSRGASAAVTVSTAVHRAVGDRSVARRIVPSRFARDMLIAGGAPEDRLVVKPHAVDPDPGPGGRQDRNGALFVGRLCAEKGIPTLLRAWERLRGRVPLLIVGDGPAAGEVAALAARDPMVRWERRLALPDVHERMKCAALVVVPSAWYETFGLVVIEAFSTGTPVVATRRGSLEELVDDGRTGVLVPPGDADALAAAVDRVGSDPAARRRMGQEGRRRYEACYTAAASYDALVSIYDAALGRAVEVGT